MLLHLAERVDRIGAHREQRAARAVVQVQVVVVDALALVDQQAERDVERLLAGPADPEVAVTLLVHGDQPLLEDAGAQHEVVDLEAQLGREATRRGGGNRGGTGGSDTHGGWTVLPQSPRASIVRPGVCRPPTGRTVRSLRGAASRRARRTARASPIDERAPAGYVAAMATVLGIGGVFVRSRDPDALRAWYRDLLGLDIQDWGGAQLHATPGTYSVWSAFRADTTYFAPSEREFMVNLRVDDLDGLLAKPARARRPRPRPPRGQRGRKIWLRGRSGRNAARALAVTRVIDATIGPRREARDDSNPCPDRDRLDGLLQPALRPAAVRPW